MKYELVIHFVLKKKGLRIVKDLEWKRDFIFLISERRRELVVSNSLFIIHDVQETT